jgi:hypothetical protein
MHTLESTCKIASEGIGPSHTGRAQEAGISGVCVHGFLFSFFDLPRQCACTLKGFGTCGWTDVGDSSTRSRLWDPLPWWYDSRELHQRPVGCPSTLAREVGPFRFGPTRSPVLRIRAHRHPVKDGDGGPLA